MTQRYIVQFPDLAAYNAAQALEVNHLRVPVANANRRFISVEVLRVDLAGAAGERYAVEQLDQLQKHDKAAMREEVQLDLEARDNFDPAHFGPDLPGTPLHDDVLQLIRADAAWTTTRGKDATIAIIDTGVNDLRREFPAWKRASAWQPLAIGPGLTGMATERCAPRSLPQRAPTAATLMGSRRMPG